MEDVEFEVGGIMYLYSPGDVLRTVEGDRCSKNIPSNFDEALSMAESHYDQLYISWCAKMGYIESE